MKSIVKNSVRNILAASLALTFAGAAGAQETPGGAHGGLIFDSISVEPGFVAYIRYNSSLASGQFKEVLKGPAATNWNFKSIQAIFVQVTPRTYTEEFTLQTSDDVQIPFRVHMIMSVQEEGVKDLVEKFTPNWYANALKEPVRTLVRKSVEGIALEQLKTTRDSLGESVRDNVAKMLVAKKMPVTLHSVEIGQFLSPKAVAEATEQKLAAQQRLEQQRTELEIVRAKNTQALETAEGELKVQAKLRGSLTPEYNQYIIGRAVEQFARNPTATTLVLNIGSTGSANGAYSYGPNSAGAKKAPESAEAAAAAASAAPIVIRKN